MGVHYVWGFLEMVGEFRVCLLVDYIYKYMNLYS